MITSLVVILLFSLLFRNISYVIIFSPFVKFYYWRRSKKGNCQKSPIANYEDYNALVKDNQSGGGNLIPVIKRGIGLYYKSFVSYYLYRLSFIASHHIRNFVYRKICNLKMAENSVIYFGTEMRDPDNIVIGRGSVIGDQSILDGRNGIIIGDNVVLASNVRIWTEQHDHRDPWFRCETQEHRSVVIDDRAWIGSHTIILHSVHIGEGAVVAAGAVVTHDVSPYTIVVGIPAKKVGERNRNLKYILDGTHRHFL